MVVGVSSSSRNSSSELLPRRLLSGVDGDGGLLLDKTRDRVKKKHKDERKREEGMRGSGVAGVARTVEFSPTATA